MSKRNLSSMKFIKTVVHLYTGEGAGKTTSVFGVALRTVGHGKKAVIIQFMKGRKDIGEYKIQKKLRNYHVYQAGSRSFIDFKHPKPDDYRRAKEGIELAERLLRKKPDLLVLDELGLAAARGLVGIEDVLGLLRKVPAKTHTYITGRENPKEFFRIATFVTQLKTLKEPKKPEYIKGIEY
ncbi:MAG TPA: cob(I)yrinic acid a,c-diamide adenosyltransferase [Candidatus Nanoarchaeia archaeon]|nr:cob(I)yrinic acid a,c-diamide adenosyltransferase [Candidatus Nanoarchaeia archaeon]